MSTHDKIVAILGTEILKGVYRPGENMPAEVDLIRRFHVSRTVMREVTKTLAAKGFVVSKTRVGTRVRDPLNWNFFDADVLSWQVRGGMDEEFLQSLTEVRRALEPAAAALAAKRRTVLDIANMRRHVSEMARSGHTRKSFAQADLAFHQSVGVATGNPLMRSVGSVIEAALVSSFSHSSPIDVPANQARSAQAHAAIIDAIEARDSQAAADAMLEVIDVGVRRIAASKKKAKRKP